MKSVEVGKPLQFLKSKGQRIVEPNEKKLNMFIFNILYVGGDQFRKLLNICVKRFRILHGVIFWTLYREYILLCIYRQTLRIEAQSRAPRKNDIYIFLFIIKKYLTYSIHAYHFTRLNLETGLAIIFTG